MIRSLETIENEINFYKQQTAIGIIEIGKRLIEAKEQLPHGEWGKWLEEKVKFTQRTSQKYMKVAKEYKDTKSIDKLEQSKIFELLSLPIDLREDFINSVHKVNGQTKTVEEMSVRELNQIVKKYKDSNKKSRKPISNITIKHITLRSQGKCEICGWGGQGLEGVLVPHHIHKYCETKDNSSDNLVMICPNCHGIIHTLENCNDENIKDIILNSLDVELATKISTYLEIISK